MRRAARQDGNHGIIVGYFEKFGCSVLNIHQLKECGDVVVAKNKKTAIVEIKDPSRPTSKRKLTVGESKFAKGWQGIYMVVEDLEDVIALVKALER